MADEVRTTLKDYNRDLLIEQLVAAPLPFESLFLAGFVRLGKFRGTPAPGPRVVAEDKVANTQDIAQPGEIRFVFTTALTVGEAAALDTLLANHVSTDHTASQDRLNQDQTDLDALEANFPNWDTFTNTQRQNFLKTLSRVVIREARKSAF
jgi:hypothetical protein